MKEKEENITIKREKPVATDADALEMIKAGTQKQFRFCDTWVPRTILHMVNIEYKPGVFTPEFRAFVRQGEWCHSSQWEKALEKEKEFAGLNKEYALYMKSKKKPLNIKPPATNATPLGINT